MIPPKPSKYICKNCGHSVVIIHNSDCFTERDFSPLICCKCKKKADWNYTQATKMEIYLEKLKSIFK